MTCDAKDRHVLAAAIHAGAAVLVTANTRDFPPQSVRGYDIEVLHPDDFLLNQLDLFPAQTVAAIERQANAMLRPDLSLYGLLDRLVSCGVPKFAGAVKQMIDHRGGS